MQLKIQLTEDEKLKLSFRVFEYQGLQVNLNQYLSGEHKFSEEHYNRVIETLLEKYTLLQKCLLGILTDHGHKNIKVKSYEFYLAEDTLIVLT
jgi:hypothetical protein